jgi:alkanesulfonate monooxygenase SsuD/methylene tetrahydromethanopterin reductase-like flavin-dependent oxidoreductase (luciferase family)
VKFWTSLPGLSRWPPASFAVPGANWQEQLAPADFQAIAAAADRLGFDSVSVHEHVVMPRELAGQMGGRWPDALTVMAFIAGATTRIAVNSGVIILPLHNPVRLAKAVATLDVLSGGRVMVTFGTGMAAGEFSALGVDFRRRGRITDEYIRAMKILWTTSRSSTASSPTSRTSCSSPSRPAGRTRRCSSAGGPSSPSGGRPGWPTAGRRPAPRAGPDRGFPARPTCPGSWPRRAAAKDSRPARPTSRSPCTPFPP